MDAHFKLAGLAILTLFIKWVVLRWFTQKMVDMFDWGIKKLLGDKPEELAIWLHYKKKRLGEAHQYPNPLRCQDGDCQLIHLY